ncbi:MAG: hypothetical protein DCC68_26670 [Planctomycetota bacterium]|nr:MAG: hypothetical protein DCC68_26670 [Planctomycetota bacterium]
MAKRKRQPASEPGVITTRDGMAAAYQTSRTTVDRWRLRDGFPKGPPWHKAAVDRFLESFGSPFAPSRAEHRRERRAAKREAQRADSGGPFADAAVRFVEGVRPIIAEARLPADRAEELLVDVAEHFHCALGMRLGGWVPDFWRVVGLFDEMSRVADRREANES